MPIWLIAFFTSFALLLITPLVFDQVVVRVGNPINQRNLKWPLVVFVFLIWVAIMLFLNTYT